MPTVRLIVRYDGTGLSGWQRQRGVQTVQEHLETAASAMACEPIVVRGAGRTDAGVHALGQVASFHTTATIPMHGWRLGMNSRLPPNIAVIDAREVSDGFDPRRASGGKRYRYLLLTSPDRDPMMHQRAWHMYSPLDVGRMQKEAEKLVGLHDFRAFRAADCERVTTRRELFRVHVGRGYQGRDDLLALEVEGTAFLKNMVRIITGTLVDVGRGRLPEGTIAARLRDGDRTRAGMTAPPHGLYLDEVFLRREYLTPNDCLRSRPVALENSAYASSTHAPHALEELDEDDD